MAEKRKAKKRKEEYVAPGEESVEKPSNDEYDIAKWMKKNVPIKKTKFLNHHVAYFTGRKAVDALLESKWATGEDPRFKSREEIVDFLHLMLQHKFYHRARKVPLSDQELKSKKKEKKANDDKEVKEIKDKEKPEKGTDAESSVVEGKPEQQDKEKKKKKIRLEMHNDQCFIDSLDAYVWIYDPIPFYYWIMGTLFVLGAIGICLFPLWPPSVRLGVYYLSIAAAGFLVAIIVLAVLRMIIFCTLWVLTLGRHHLWILPNLTEDVGFFASFWPLYTYKYQPPGSSSKKGKKKKKDKDSDAEDEIDTKSEPKEETEEVKTIGYTNVADEDRNSDDSERKSGGNGGGDERTAEGSENESESSQRSSTGKDFEMVDQQELDS